MTPKDLLPRQFQADCERFFQSVIAPALATLRPSSPNTVTEFASVTEFLDACTQSTFNLLAYEARRSFALTLGAIFERQLRIWSRVHSTAPRDLTHFDPMLKAAAAKHRIDLSRYDVGRILRELYLLANAVRHGDGTAVEELRKTALHLWPGLSLEAVERCNAMSIWSEAIQLSDDDLARYATAIARFWGLADREQGAMIDAHTPSEYF
ncbi:MAG: hypothetical protein B7Z40_08695 [Bosea sp. 12-68-7]|nr:MAG: hypothetical protein B7Z40_08695 [Bosea sp. 12-68-7]